MNRCYCSTAYAIMMKAKQFSSLHTLQPLAKGNRERNRRSMRSQAFSSASKVHGVKESRNINTLLDLRKIFVVGLDECLSEDKVWESEARL